MDNEIVIQLAKFNDKTTTNNSNWSNNTSESITINQGDQILVSKAFIDTRDLTSANITIQKDIELELEYHFYWINDSNPGTNANGFGSSTGVKGPWLVPLDPLDYNDPNKTESYNPVEMYADGFKNLNDNLVYEPPNYSVQITSQNTKNIEFNTAICSPNGWSGTAPNVLPTSKQNVMYADGRPYLMCYSDNSPYTQSWKYTLKAGSYSPDSLASLLTLNMATVKKDTEQSMEYNQSDEWFNTGQPFVVNTSSYPPIWCMTNTPYNDPDGDGPFFSVINSNPYIQIDRSRGSVKTTDWYNGSTGSVGYTGQPDNYLLPIIPAETIGPSPKKSLCFKNFISDSPTPNSSVNLPSITNPTITADNMIPGLYYKIVTVADTNWIKSGDTNPVPAIADEFLCVFTGIVPDTIIPVSQMTNGKTYKIQSLGNSWNGEYDTNWLGLNNTLTSPNIGDVFVCQDNTSIQIAFDIDAEIDTINTFTFTLCNGYDLSTIGGPALPSFSKTPKNIYDNVKRNNWVIITVISPNFIGRNDNGIDYSQFMGALQTTIPVNATQYISTIDMTTYTPTPLNGYTDLNDVSIGMRLQVSTIGSVNWSLLGVKNNNNIVSVSQTSTGYFIVENTGISYGLNNSLKDTNWNYITNSTNPNPSVNDIVNISLSDTGTPYTNATIHNINELTTTDFSDQYIVIVSMGTSVYEDWYSYITRSGAVGETAKLNPQSAYDGSLNNTGATFQVLQQGLLSIGMKITATLVDKLNWAIYTSTPNTPVLTGDIITITTLPDILLTGYTDNFTGMNDTFTVMPSGLIKSTSIPTPFSFVVSQLSSFVDDSIPFVAVVLPNDFGEIRNNYTLPLKPFKPTGILSSNVINKVFSANVLSTGTVEQNTTQGTCVEVFSPDVPNFYIYPLILQNKCNSVSYIYEDKMTEVDSFFGGPQFTYGFPLIGSTEIELAFNDNTNRFQWNYTHSPIQQGSAPGTTPVTTTGVTSYSEVVGMINSFVPNPDILTDTTQPAYNTSMCKLTAQSGIIFKKMEPASFWQDILGFSKDLIVTDEELGLTNDGTLQPITPANKDRFKLERFNDITTTGLLTSAMNFTTLDNFPNAQESYVAGLRANTNGFNNVVGPVQLAYSPVVNQWSGNENISDFYREFSSKYKITGLPSDGSFPTTPTLNSIYYQALDETKYINSISPPLLIEDKYGHYLVSIDGYGSSSGLINEKQKILSKAIISNYYVNQNSFVSLTFPDSQVYTHVGEPLELNNFNISILNPDTMKQIEGLGENSCVYIQINKQYSKEMSSQV